MGIKRNYQKRSGYVHPPAYRKSELLAVLEKRGSINDAAMELGMQPVQFSAQLKNYGDYTPVELPEQDEINPSLNTVGLNDISVFRKSKEEVVFTEDDFVHDPLIEYNRFLDKPIGTVQEFIKCRKG